MPTHRYHSATVACALATISVVLPGCSTFESIDRIARRAQSQEAEAAQQHAAFIRQTGDTRRQLNAHINRPWIAGKAQPLARDISLPPALQAKVKTTLIYPGGPIDLHTLAQRIHQATGIPVRISPDALMPAQAFAPRLNIDHTRVADLDAPSAAIDLDIPAIGPLGGMSRTSGPQQSPAGLVIGDLPPGQAPLSTILDAIAIKLGIYWRYKAEIAAIELYRTESRSFNIRALTQAAQTEMELGLTGQGGSVQAGGGRFASLNRATIKDIDPSSTRQAVVAKLTQWLTRAGVVQSHEGASNTIVITDTPEALDRVATYLDQENKALTRRVRIHLQEVTVQREDIGQAGLEWQALFDSGGRHNTAALNSLTGLLDNSKSAAMLNGAAGIGPWMGSRITVQALSQLGRIVRNTDYSLLVLNRRPGTFATRDTFSYIKNLEQTQSNSNASGPTVTVQQQDETVGTFLTMVPDAQEDGQILLTVAYDNTRLVSLEKQQFGDRDNPSFVQQPKINGTGNIQQVELRPGVPALIAGTAQTLDSFTRRRLDKDMPMLAGGADSTTEQQLLTLLIVTAIPEDSL